MRRRRERGAVIVETAIGLPILLLFVFGLVDLGRWSLEANQAEGAARDGARAGIFSFEEADDAGSADHDAIVSSIHARLELDASAVSVGVTCVTPADATIDCTNAVPDLDRLVVDVSWTLPLVTPAANAIGRDTVTVDASSTMLIVGLPVADTAAPPTTTTTSTPSSTSTTTTAPPTCSLASSPTVTPNSVAHNGGSGKLKSDVLIQFTPVGGGCSALSVRLTAPNGASFDHVCGCGGGPIRAWTYAKANADPHWTAGTATVTILDLGSPIGSANFTVT